MLQSVGQICPSIPAGATIRVQRRGMDWCTDTAGNTYILAEESDEFVTYVTHTLLASDMIMTGTDKEKRKTWRSAARNYSWRLPRHWTITLTRSAISS